MSDNGWIQFLNSERSKNYFKNIESFIKSERQAGKIIYPDDTSVFNAFKYCPLEKTKVVILGMDPYVRSGQAHGLSFSVLCTELPPSLKNIFKELKDDLGIDNISGNLAPWTQQGVLLLNSFLTVEDGKSNSHSKIGWQELTDSAIQLLNQSKQPIVFILWGGAAKTKSKFVTNKQHLVLSSAHPSPLSAHNGFFGSKPFSKTNEFLVSHKLEPIDWTT